MTRTPKAPARTPQQQLEHTLRHGARAIPERVWNYGITPGERAKLVQAVPRYTRTRTNGIAKAK